MEKSKSRWNVNNFGYAGGNEIMRYFIDTNIFLFWVSEQSSLNYKTLDILDDYSNTIYVSSRVVDELIQLFQFGKIKDKKWEKAEDVIDFIKTELGFEIKNIKEEHLRTLANLPFFEDHKDPTDRMIVAHAISEKIPIISSDKKFFYYNKYGLDFIYNKR
jgi:PIN domain nuclease of toxin-antitoxin system